MTARDDTALRLLDAAIHSLRADLLPLLGEDIARMRVDHVTRLLRMVSARLSLREDSLRAFMDGAAKAGIAVPASSDALERQRQDVEAAITHALPTLLEAAGRGDEQALNRLENLIAMEKAFYLSHDPDIRHGSIVAYRGGRIDGEAVPARSEPWPAVTAEALTAYLRQHFQRDSVHAEAVRLVPGGFSKETLFFTAVDAAANTRQDLVMRKDMPLPFIDQTVADEFDLLRALHARGFPVARPLWLEADTQALGAPFLVSERVGGSSNAAQWAADPARAARACRELARVLATLHAFSPEQLGLTATQRSAGEQVREQIARWTRLFHARRQQALPLQELPLVWLARNIPPALFERPARVVHGDFGFHNMLFDEQGEVAALLDWEFAALGEPTQDLCFVRLFVEPLMPWTEFLALYHGFGGITPCEESAFFFDLWTKARNSIGCVAGGRLFDTALPHETKFALVGHVFAPYLWLEECESLIAHLKREART